MKTSTDPSLHRQREQQLVQHVQRLLSDDRLRVDTTAGHRSITTLIRDVTRTDQAVELKRRMADAGVYDREVQNRMPVGEAVEVTLSQKRFWFFRATVGRMRIVCVSPTDALLKGEAPRPLNTGDVQKVLGSLPPSLGGVPQTVVLMSTSGFTREAHELAERRAGRTVVMVEPNDAGGWTVSGPPDTSGILDLFDPEGEDDKRQRVRQEIETNQVEILTSGLTADRLASRLQVPQPIVEAALRDYARANPGLAAKRLDGRFVLFREGSAVPSAEGSAYPAAGGASSMPLIDRMKALFSRKADDQKKIEFLAERRAALTVQRDRSYEEIDTLGKQEEQLIRQFKESAGTITKKKVTSQLLQLRKDLERRQQLLGVLNQQINVVSTHLHNLELVRQGQRADLPSSEDLTADAVKAEEVLAELEASSELAGSVGLSSTTGLTEEEQALYDELERDAKGPEEAETPATGEKTAAGEPRRTKEPPAPPERDRTASSTQRDRQRGQAEPG
jgi:hypothetical protein